MNVGELQLDGSGFVHTLKTCDEKLSGFLGKVASIGSILGGSFVALEGIHKLVEGFEGVLELGAHLHDLGLATGQSAHDLVILEHALDLTGGSAADAQNFIFKLQTALSGVNEEGKSTSTALRALGLTQKELRDKSVIEQVELLQQGLAKVASQSDKAAIVKDLFGFRFAAKAMPLLSSPEGMETALRQAEPLANVMEKNAASFHALDDAIKGLKLNFKEFFAGALQGFAPNATEIADAFADIDFVGIGEGVGALINVFVSLAKVLALLAPAIEYVSKAISGLNASTLGGGAIGALVGFMVAGPVGAIIGAVAGGFVGNLTGGGGEKHEGFADKFRGLQGGGDEAERLPVSAIQKIGGGGGFGAEGDPMLSEARTHTQLLRNIANSVSSPNSAHAPEHKPVPV